MPRKVTIYTTQYCPHCTRAKHLLRSKKIEFEEINIETDESKRLEIEEKTGWMTVPIIFFGDELIGGADELYALEEKHQLDNKLNA